MTIFSSGNDSHMQDNSRVFGGDTWVKRQNYFWEQASQGFYPRVSNLPNLVGNFNPDLILDFGGGSGWIVNFLDSTFHEKFLVIESDDFVQEYPKPDTFLILTLDDFVKKFSLYSFTNKIILYSNSTLQYLSDLFSFFELIKLVKPTYVLLDDVILSNGEKISLYQNYYSHKIPYYIHDASFFYQSFSSFGYREQFNLAYGDSILNSRILNDIRIAVKDSDIIGPSSLLFITEN